jgi:hypothetical protein
LNYEESKLFPEIKEMMHNYKLCSRNISLVKNPGHPAISKNPVTAHCEAEEKSCQKIVQGNSGLAV